MCRHDLSPQGPQCPPCPEQQPREGSTPPAPSSSQLRRQAPRRPVPTPTLAPMPQPVEIDIAAPTAAPQYEEAVVVVVPVVTQPEAGGEEARV